MINYIDLLFLSYLYNLSLFLKFIKNNITFIVSNIFVLRVKYI